MVLLVVCASDLRAQDYVIDKNHPDCDNQGPGREDRPWCNFWGLNERWLTPGATVYVKAGTYIGNEDSTEAFQYHNGIGIRGFGTREAPFTLRAWPGDAGKVNVHAGKRDERTAFLFWGGHVRIEGLNFVGHVELPEGGRLYAPRLIRFGITDGPVTDIRFDSVRIVAFQGADDVGLGCRFMDHVPVGECSITRPAEGWARGIDINGVSDMTFENGGITCMDETGKADIEAIKAQGLHLGGDGVKSGSFCSGMTFRNSTFGSCAHDDLMFVGCDSVLVEHNRFENELHQSLSFAYGGGHIVRYNTFAAWEKRRVELRPGGGAALQLRTSNSRFHHNIFYGGGEPNHAGAIKIAAMEDFVVANNEIFNNVMLARNAVSFCLNDKFARPFNLQNNRIYNNIFIGQDTEKGVFSWEVAEREAYFAGESFGNEIRNNIIHSLTADPEIVSFSNFASPILLSEDEFNALAVAEGNRIGDPGLAFVSFDEPDFRVTSSCLPVNAGLPVNVEYDFEGNPIGKVGAPTIGAYSSSLRPFPAPGLLQPADSTAGIPPFAEFDWEEVDGATAYHLQVEGEDSFDRALIDIEGLASTWFLTKDPLPYNSGLRWRVRVSAGGGMDWPESSGCTPWSPEAAFSTATGVQTEQQPGVPSRLQIEGGYPNPFVTSTTIRFAVPRQSAVSLSVFDALGRRVDELVDGPLAAGYHEILWSTAPVGSGLYFVRLSSGDAVEIVPIVRVR